MIITRIYYLLLYYISYQTKVHVECIDIEKIFTIRFLFPYKLSFESLELIVGGLPGA